MQKTCTIVANGEFARSSRVLERLSRAEFVIACDGACNKLHSRGLSFDIGIGDFDSIDMSAMSGQNLIHIKEQETNDLTKAVLKAYELGFERIEILCATGLRDDHHIGNVFHLEYYKDLRPFSSVSILSDFGEFVCHQGSFVQKCHKSQQISLFATDKSAVFNSSGLKYPLVDFRFKYIFAGTLNEALADSFSITTAPSSKMIVYLANQ